MEKRRYPRLPVDLLVWVTPKKVPPDEAEKLFARIKNMSLGGVFVEMEKPFPPETFVHLGFRLLGSDLVVETDGVVMWSASNKGMGIQFLDITAREQAGVLDFLASEKEKSGSRQSPP